MKRKPGLLLVSIAFSVFIFSILGWFAVRLFARAGLQVDALISNSRGEPQAAARASLYLLSQDILELALVKEGELTPLQERVFGENPGLRNLAQVMNARRREAYSLGPDAARFVEESRSLWQPHVIQEARADAGGRARFSNIKPGNYWLVGLAETGEGGVAFWNLPVSLARGETKLKLGPHNSLQCSFCR